jgi:two-component system, LytTR family, sensor kinase
LIRESSHPHAVTTYDAPRVDWRFATLCAILLGLLFATQAWINAPDGTPITYSFALIRATAAWGAWLALVPLIVRAGRTNPLGADSRARWVLRHIWLATAFAAAHSLLMVIFRAMLGIPVGGGLIAAFLMVLFTNFAGDVLRYSLISVAYQAWAYHRAVRERDAQAARLKVDLAEAKLATLEGRLRPHFLFNTLNAVAALIREDPSAAEVMVGQLSDLLRASLKADPMRQVTLDDELVLVEQYLSIEHARFQDRLEATIRATPAARSAFVPHLILQPLVENAVRHGIAPRETGGRMWVHADQIGDRLIITIEDDGVGLGNSPSAQAGSGVGLGGVRARLEHLYGREQKLDVETRRPSGTTVRIELPYRSAEVLVVEQHA